LRGMLSDRQDQPGSNSRHKGFSSFMNAHNFVGADIYLPLRFRLYQPASPLSEQ